MVIRREKNKRVKCCFILFSIIFLSCSMVVTADILSSAITIAWWILCAALLLTESKYVNRTLLIIFLMLVTVVLISSVVNGENVFNQIKVLFAFFVVILFVNHYNYIDVIKAFLNVMLIICFISLPLYFVCLSQPSFLNNLIIIGPQEHRYYNMYIYCHNLFNGRNSGLFWEPGVFTTFINLALLLELLEVTGVKKMSFRLLTVGTLFFTNLLTFSTTGYIACAIVLLIYLFSKTHSKLEKTAINVLLFLLIAIVVVVYSEKLFGDGTLYTFGKLQVLFDGNAFDSDRTTSLSVRAYSITKPLEIFFQNPLFGVGVSNLKSMTEQYTRGAITCTFANWFAIYGVFYGAIMLVGYIKIVVFSDRNKVIKALIFIFLMVSIISENYSANACFVGIALLGFKREEENKMTLRGENEKQSVVQRGIVTR